jgi:beta-1,2-mannosidase
MNYTHLNRQFLTAVIIFLFLHAACKNTGKNKTETNDDWALTGFVKADSVNPMLQPSAKANFTCPVKKNTVFWEEKNVLNPSALVKDNKVFLVYRAQDSGMTSRLGLAVSEDGIHFTKQPAPVFYPGNDSMFRYEWKGGVEDPRIVESEDGRYILTYTAYDGKTARLCIASSKDLIDWTKHGLVLSAEKHKNTWSKSGAIVCRMEGSRTIATKINGRYWMYFGDTQLFMASSFDLIHWEAAENAENQTLISVLHPRMGYFDSRLVEPGPFALIRPEGILLIYNGSNAANFNDTALPKFTYSAGQALFDKSNPYKLLQRTNSYFLHPDKPYEKMGEVNEVCFAEGLVYFKKKWFLYYGTADSKIAVAVKEE